MTETNWLVALPFFSCILHPLLQLVKVLSYIRNPDTAQLNVLCIIRSLDLFILHVYYFVSFDLFLSIIPPLPFQISVRTLGLSFM